MNILQLHREGVYPPTNGGETRVWKTAEMLAQKAQVSLATPAANTYPSENIKSIKIGTNTLSRKVLRIYLWNLSFLSEGLAYPKFVSKRVESHFSDLESEYSLVICESPQVFLPALKIASRHDAELLLNKHNAYFQLVHRYLNQKGFVPNSIATQIKSNIREFEKFCVENADIAIFQSEKDLEMFSDVLPAKSGVIPNGTDFSEIDNGDRERGREILGLSDDRLVCLFVGSYDYAPNNQAAKFIAKNLAPEHQDVEFVLIGRNPPSFGQENVRSAGFVKSYADVLAAGDIALCPLFIGSGTKLKMLDYLAASLPIITTPLGAQGLDINENNSLIKSDEIGFINGIETLKQNPSCRERLSQKSRSLGKKYDWKQLMEQYSEYVEF